MNKTSQNLGSCSHRNSSAHGYCGCYHDAKTDKDGNHVPARIFAPASTEDPNDHKRECMKHGDRTPAYYEEFNGSCCLSDGTCIETGPTDCKSKGGSWTGESHCDQRDCSKEPTTSSASARNFYKRAKALSLDCPDCTRNRH
jgi:hypothetical protein